MPGKRIPARLGLGVIILSLAGCTGPGANAEFRPPTAAEPFEPAEFSETTGAITGLVTDDSLVPIEGADVTIVDLGLLSQTSADGTFAFSYLPAQRLTVGVAKSGFAGQLMDVDVPQGAVAQVYVELVALPAAGAYHVTLVGAGRLNCGAAAWSPYTNGTLHNGSWAFPPCPVSPTGQVGDTSIVNFGATAEAAVKIQTMVFETKWRSNQVLSRTLGVYWYRQLETAYTEPSLSVAAGASPLRSSVSGDVLLDHVRKNLPNDGGCPIDGNCKFRAHVFAYAHDDPIQVTLVYDQPFVHYATQFYGLPAPAQFSAISDQ